MTLNLFLNACTLNPVLYRQGRYPVTLEEEEDSGLFVLENGAEFSLTPLNKRKSAFETERRTSYGNTGRRSNQPYANGHVGGVGTGLGGVGTAPGGVGTVLGGVGTVLGRAGGTTKAPIHVEILEKETNYVKSSNIPYIEEEKTVLENIKIVNSIKKKFLQL